VGRDITLATTADLRALANLQVRMCWALIERLDMLGCERYLKESFPDGPLATPDWELTQTFDPEMVNLVEELFCTAVDSRRAREELAVRALPN
jgi:hypothetical protein